MSRVTHDGRAPRGLEPGARVVVVHGKPWKRTITMSGVVDSWSDGLLVIRRQFSPGGLYDSLDEPKRAGDYGTIEVAAGSWLLRRTYFRGGGELIGELYNVQTPAELRPGRVEYVDLEVDVVRWPDGRVAVVDEADLEAAVRAGGITPELAATAREIASELATTLDRGGDWRAADPGQRPGMV